MNQPRELDVKLTYVDNTVAVGTASGTGGSSAQPVVFTISLPVLLPLQSAAPVSGASSVAHRGAADVASHRQY